MVKRRILIVFLLISVLFLTACNTIIGAITETKVTIIGPTTLNIGESVQLSYTITPEAKAEGGVIWHSNNEELATITTDGVLTGVKSGRVSITATAVSDEAAIGKIFVKIVEEEITYTNEAPTSIDIISASEIQNGTVSYLRFKTTPNNASQDVTWSVDNSLCAGDDLVTNGVITINDNGVLIIPDHITGESR